MVRIFFQEGGVGWFITVKKSFKKCEITEGGVEKNVRKCDMGGGSQNCQKRFEIIFERLLMAFSIIVSIHSMFPVKEN